jgi:hypothetical protein
VKVTMPPRRGPRRRDLPPAKISLLFSAGFGIRSRVTEVAAAAELSLFARLCLIMAGVLGIGAASAQPSGERASILAVLYARHAQAMRRFAVVARKFFAGPARARPAAAAAPRAPVRQAPSSAAAPALPEHAYSALLPDHARTYSGYLRDLLRDPDMQALLAASPRARLLLRPLLRMYSDDPLPDCVRLPPPGQTPPVRGAANAQPRGACTDPATETPAATETQAATGTPAVAAAPATADRPTCAVQLPVAAVSSARPPSRAAVPTTAESNCPAATEIPNGDDPPSGASRPRSHQSTPAFA